MDIPVPLVLDKEVRPAHLADIVVVAADPAEQRVAVPQLNFDLAKLQRTYSDKYPDVILTKQEIENTKKQLAELGPSAGKSSAPKAAAPPRAMDSELAGLNAAYPVTQLAVVMKF